MYLSLCNLYFDIHKKLDHVLVNPKTLNLSQLTKYPSLNTLLSHNFLQLLILHLIRDLIHSLTLLQLNSCNPQTLQINTPPFYLLLYHSHHLSNNIQDSNNTVYFQGHLRSPTLLDPLHLLTNLTRLPLL